jgi:uncharacterized protein
MDTTPPLSPTPPPVATTDWRLYFELLGLAGFVFPLGNIFGPLILWLIKKDTDSVADFEGKKVINFNLSWTLWAIVTCGLGALVWVVILVISIIKAANRQPFKHPLTIQFLK